MRTKIILLPVVITSFVVSFSCFACNTTHSPVENEQVINERQISSVIVYGEQNLKFEHDGLIRDYTIYVPQCYTGKEAVPLVVALHGRSGTGHSFLARTRFNNIADTANFIVVCPQATVEVNSGYTTWFVDRDNSPVDDYSFIEALQDTITSTYNIDKGRVYYTGGSNGAYLLYCLVFYMNKKITAIAPSSGQMTKPQISPLVTASNLHHPTPVFHIHGDSDQFVPYDIGKHGGLDVDSGLRFWINYNQCQTKADTCIIPDTNKEDGSTVQHIYYSGGKGGASVELLKIMGGGHAWPGFDGNMDIDAGVEIWRFFSSYRLENGILTKSKAPDNCPDH